MKPRRWHHASIIQKVRRERLISASGRPLASSDYLYHNTTESALLGIIAHDLLSAPFHDMVDEEQAETYRNFSVIWFTDNATEFREGRSVQLRVRLGDLLVHAGELIDPGQGGGDSKHFFVGVETRAGLVARQVRLPVGVLEGRTGAAPTSWLPLAGVAPVLARSGPRGG